jgi:chromate reductase
MKLMLFSGSLRKASLNKKLLAVAHTILSEIGGHEVKVVDLQGLAIPVYDGDIESAGIPAGVLELGKFAENAEAFIICSPEYNGSMAGSLKNTLDWLSRLKPVPLAGKPILLLGASPGGFGAVRGLGHARQTYDTLGAYVYPQVFGLAKAHEAFSPTGDLLDLANRKKLAELIANYLQFAMKLTKK